MSTAPVPRASLERIPVFEGLRAYLAWWVVGCHLLTECGFEGRFLPGILRAINSGGGEAVKVFITLSGFVITHLLLEKQESYARFISRRFFRLYPIFITSVLLGLIFLPQIEGLHLFAREKLQSSALEPDSWWPSYSTHLWGYVAASSTMLHGAMPHALLPHAQAAFNSPGWSVSLEWQFYLVMPFLFRWARARPLPVLAGVAFVLFAARSLPIGEWGSFLPHRAEWFLLGCVSCLLYHRLPALAGPASVPWTAWTFVLFWSLSPDWRALLTWSYDFHVGSWLALGIWLHVFALALDARAVVSGRPPWFTRMFTCRWIQILGRVSFSTYLLHYFALYLGLAVFRHLAIAPDKYHALAVVAPITVIMTAVLSFLFYHGIERPGIWLGQKAFRKPLIAEMAPTPKC